MKKKWMKKSTSRMPAACNPYVFSTFLENDRIMPPTSAFSLFNSPFTPVETISLLFFSSSLLCLCRSMIPIYERATHGCQRPFRFVRKVSLSSVIFFGATDNNMAYNRIGIMPVALHPDTKSRILL